MKDYLNSTKTKKYQAGGPAPGGPAPEGGPAGGPEAEIQAMLQQVIESQDAQLALEVCNKLYEMLTGQASAPASAQGKQAPAMPAKSQGQPEPNAVPMGRYGMKTKPVMPK